MVITKNEVLPLTTFRKYCFSIRTSYKQLICGTNNSIPIFLLSISAGILFDGAGGLFDV